MAIFCNLMYYIYYVGKFDGLKMTLKHFKISLILVLSLGLLPIVSDMAVANNLTRLDIKRNTSSESAVDVTLYTTTPYNDSVAVTKKSANKYVILMPNVSGTSSKSPDLSGLKDVISNVDIKSVNDGVGSYTKVTLTTTKPINIKTRTQKSLPVTEGQKAYQELLAQSENRVYVPVKPALKEPQKPVNTVIKSEKQVKTSVTKEAAKPAVEKKVDKNVNIAAKTKKTLKDVTVKKEIKKVEKNTEPSPVKNTTMANSINKSADTGLKTVQSVPEVKPQTEKQLETVPAAVNVDTPQEPQLKTRNGRIPPNMPITLAMILIPLAGLVFLFKLIKSSMQNSSILKKTFIANLKNKKDPVNNYDHIINADMNWQEKYQKFVAVSNKNYEKSPKKLASDTSGFAKIPAAAALSAKPEAQPSFVSQEDVKETVNVAPKVKTKKIKKVTQKSKVEISEAVKEMERQINNLEAEKANTLSKEIIEKPPVDNNEPQSVDRLEKILHESPSVEKTDLDDDAILKALEQNFKAVQSEDNAISAKMSEISKAPKIKKLKAFANTPMLQETHRNIPLPKTPEEVKRAAYQEGKHVHLGYSKLHSNPRLLEGANLSAADLIAKSSRFLPDNLKVSTPKPVVAKNTPKPQPKSQSSVKDDNTGYMMATIDEFFALSDDMSKVTASEELSNKVASSLANIKPSMKQNLHNEKTMTNPISQLKSETQESYLNGLIVKSGFNIDKDRGFYLVNVDGETALIGRIKEEVFVLKKFDRPIEKPLQVRKDNPNVYMVKTDGFRSLVEVSENNMGVLIEL